MVQNPGRRQAKLNHPKMPPVTLKKSNPYTGQLPVRAWCTWQRSWHFHGPFPVEPWGFITLPMDGGNWDAFDLAAAAASLIVFVANLSFVLLLLFHVVSVVICCCCCCCCWWWWWWCCCFCWFLGLLDNDGSVCTAKHPKNTPFCNPPR